MMIYILVLCLLIQSVIVYAADITRFSFFTHVFWSDQNNVYRMCGGSLISDTHVLTAAHCIPSNNSIEVSVSFTSNSNNSQFHAIQNIYIHPEFNKTNAVVWADVAILQMYKATKIPKIEIQGTKNKELGSIIGYASDFNILKEMILPIVSRKECHDYYFTYGIPITKDLICVQNGDFHLTPCNGDSGGPLLIQKKEKWYLFGIVSFTVGKCATVGGYTVFTNAFFYRDWIESFLRS